MKKKGLKNTKKIVFSCENIIYELDIQKFECTLIVLGFSIEKILDSYQLIEFLKKNDLYNREFVEFISYENH